MDGSLTSRAAFWWGLLGSALPEVVRIYKIVTSGAGEPHFSWPYFLISVVFLLCAGFFTWAWKPESSFKAVWVGISFPVMVSTLAQALPSLPSK